MINKINLVDEKEKFQAFGINTSLKDFQLCSVINKFYSIDTKLLSTIKLDNKLSVFGDAIDDLKVLLIQNKYHNNKIIFSKLQVFEYIIVLNNFEENNLNVVLTLENIKEVLYISKVEHKFISNKDQTLIYQLLNLL